MRLRITIHAAREMAADDISTGHIEAVLRTGEAIETYPEDTPYPSRLVLAWVGGRPIHVVAAYNLADDEEIIITTYRPDPTRWDPTFRVRIPRLQR